MCVAGHCGSALSHAPAAGSAPRCAACGWTCPTACTDVTVRVSSDNRPSVRVAAGSTVNLSLRCPSGYIPTGQGVGVSTRAVKLVAAVPNRRGWSFRVENNGGSMARANASIRCLQRVAVGRRGGARTSLAFGVKRVAYNAPSPLGQEPLHQRHLRSRPLQREHGHSRSTRATTSRCCAATPSAAGTATWFFSNRGAPEPVTNYLLCLSRGSRFR